MLARHISLNSSPFQGILRLQVRPPQAQGKEGQRPLARPLLPPGSPPLLIRFSIRNNRMKNYPGREGQRKPAPRRTGGRGREGRALTAQGPVPLFFKVSHLRVRTFSERRAGPPVGALLSTSALHMPTRFLLPVLPASLPPGRPSPRTQHPVV